jgi:3-hydroxybutyryl-CoA dehydrogenase
MVGTDLTLAIHEYILKHLENSPAASPLLKMMVEDVDLGFKTGKGFMKWPEEKIKESRNKLQKYLLEKIKKEK